MKNSKPISKEKQKELLYSSYFSGKPLIAPKTCSIGITSQCNSKCTYCNTWSNQKDIPHKELSLEHFMQIADSLKKIGVEEILFSGGEPFLHSRLLELMKYSNKIGFKTRIITNGINLNEKIITDLISVGLKRIGISIDALTPEIYYKTRGVSIDNCLETLNILRKIKIKNSSLRVDLYTVINKYNLNELLPLQDFANESSFRNSYQTLQMDEEIPKRINSVWLNEEEICNLEGIINQLILRKKKGYPINNEENYLHNITKFFKERNTIPEQCFAGYLRINIDEYLNVKTCWMMPPVGNLYKENLEDIWNEDSEKLINNRSLIFNKQCPGCFFPCHIEANLTFGTRT